jgi:hypothetical protein
VLSEGITTDHAKLKVVQEWRTLWNKHEIRSFFSLCTYYRRFISSFANIAEPLTRPMEEKQAFQRSSEVETTFQSLKEAPCTTTLLFKLIIYKSQGRLYAKEQVT